MNLITCQDIAHKGEAIQGFCLNLQCQDSRPQFCLQCGFDPKKHSNCKNDLKGFGQIQTFITKFNQNILDLATQLNKSFAQVKVKYEEFSKQLENMKIHLVKISDCLSQQDYQQMKGYLQVIKEWYQYLNNQEDIMKQNQIVIIIIMNLINIIRIKRMIKALDLEQGQQQIQDIKQDNEGALQQGIQLNQMNQKAIILNQQKWQEAKEKINQYIKLSEKRQSLATFFKSICLQTRLFYCFIIEMNQPGQGIMMREQAKKINNNLNRDLFDYADQELIKTPQNSFMLLAKSYVLKFEATSDLLQTMRRNFKKQLSYAKRC